MRLVTKDLVYGLYSVTTSPFRHGLLNADEDNVVDATEIVLSVSPSPISMFPSSFFDSTWDIHRGIKIVIMHFLQCS